MQTSTRIFAGASAAALAVAACDEQARPEQSPDTKGKAMRSAKGFVGNIEAMIEQNTDSRRVVYTSPHEQLVVMALPPREHIGAEVHGVDHFFRVEMGRARSSSTWRRCRSGPARPSSSPQERGTTSSTPGPGR